MKLLKPVLMFIALVLTSLTVSALPYSQTGEAVLERINELNNTCNQIALSMAANRLTQIDAFALRTRNLVLNYQQRNLTLDMLFGVARRECIYSQVKSTGSTDNEVIWVDSKIAVGNTTLMRLLNDALNWKAEHVYLPRALDYLVSFESYIRTLARSVKPGGVLILDNFSYFYKNVRPQNQSLFVLLNKYLPKDSEIVVINDEPGVLPTELDSERITFKANGYGTLHAQNCKDSLKN